MIVVGVDENGLGPLLGPLVATAVSLHVDTYEAKKLRRRGIRIGIADSKATSAFGAMAQAESVALAAIEALHGSLPLDVDELLGALSLDGAHTLREPCPSASHGQCWGAPLALPAFGGDVSEGRKALTKLAKAGVTLLRARSAWVCAGVYNRTVREGPNKFELDLALFERLIQDARAAAPEDVLAICGMVGGIRDYTTRFAHFHADDVSEVEVTRKACRYHVARVGRVEFEIDSDDGHLPVALASMIGKYLRELAMERLGRFYRGHDESLPHASGYRDPVTKRFIAESSPLRRRLGIVDDCFQRVS